MVKIFKYLLKMTDKQVIELPFPAKILSVAEQRGDLVLYAMVVPDHAEKKSIVIRIFGTGHPFEISEVSSMDFIGTVKMLDGELMWHIFAGH